MIIKPDSFFCDMSHIPFQTIDWNTISKVEHRGASGTSDWQTVEYPGLRLRIVSYSPGYLADHWCRKGHIVYCLEGSFTTELSPTDKITISEGESYIVSDDLSEHRSFTEHGTRLFIVDGDFLGSDKMKQKTIDE